MDILTRFAAPHGLRGLSATLMAGTAGLAIAVTAPTPSLAQDSEIFGIEEIVVTSRKREESLQDAPLSVTAFSAPMLEARGVTSFNDLNNFAPNIELNNGRVDGGGSVAQLYIRGVGQEDYSFPNDPGVGVYLDGVYVSRSSGGDFGFMDIERVEVLRGPQGTLYGKNTIGGAINVITRKPQPEQEFRAEATYGRFDRIDFMASANVPITETLFARINGMTRSREGYGEDFTGDDLRREDKSAVRAQLLAQPDSDLEILFQAEFSRQRATGAVGAMRQFFDDGGAGIVSLVNQFQAPGEAAEFGLQPPFDTFGPQWINLINETEEFRSGGASETRDNNEIWGVSLTVDYSWGDIDIKSISAYRNVTIDVQRDGDHTPFQVVQVGVDEETEAYSQELQFSSTAFGDRMPWLFGLYYIREEGFNSFRAPLVPGVTEAIGLDISLLTDTRLKTDSFAAFGETTYYITEDLGLTFGARYAWERKEYTYKLDRIFSGITIIPSVTNSDIYREFLPKAGLEYSLNEDVLLYATAARGFKSGGYNPRTLTPGTQPQPFGPESIWTYEVGMKSSWWDGRATLNLAAFWSRYKDIQLIAVTDVAIDSDGDGINDTTTVDTSINNAGSGRIYGGEVELTVRPSQAFLFNLGLGLLETEYTDLGQSVIDAGTASLDNEFLQSPKLTLNAGAEYTFDLENGGAVILHGDVAYKSKIYRSVQNFPDLVTDPYAIANTRVTYVAPSDNWEIAFFITNLTDKIYLANGVDVRGLGYSEGYYNRPREWGVTVKARF